MTSTEAVLAQPAVSASTPSPDAASRSVGGPFGAGMHDIETLAKVQIKAI